jgi:hypothetical protein
VAGQNDQWTEKDVGGVMISGQRRVGRGRMIVT